MSLSKNQIKFIKSLELKKNRLAEGAFLAEGPKVVGDLLGRFPCRLLAGTREWCAGSGMGDIKEVIEVSAEELSRASLLKTPQQVLAVFEFPAHEQLTGLQAPRQELCLALDGVQDPGNVGTIIRLADWFGIRHVFCSLGTADAFSPKVVQATMGSIARVGVHPASLPDLITGLGQDVPTYGTFLDGNDIYAEDLPPCGLLIMGNEGRGISPEVARLVSHRISIPAYPAGRTDVPDSLNVAIATAIACAEWRRRAAKS